MVIYKQYKNEEYQKFLSKNFYDNFGFTETKMANWFMAQPGAQSVIASYGVTHKNLLSTFIPTLKKYLHGGYFMFLAISVNEGGGAGNWINHYTNDTSSTGLGCMIDDCRYINSLLQSKAYPPSLGAREVNGGVQVPEDVPGTARNLLNSLPLGSIGRYYMPATMAGNAWVFCTNWCIAHQGPVPGAYFNNPYDQIINLLKRAGVDPFGDSGQKPIDVKPEPPNTLVTDPVELFKKALDAMFKDLYSINNPNYFYNKFIKIQKELNNMYKISANFDIEKMTLQSINDLFGGKAPGGDTSKPNGGNQKGYFWPFLSDKITVTSPYGYRDPSIGSGAFHQGIDMIETGYSRRWIYAIHAGKVTLCSDRVPGWESAGSMILIKNDTDGKIVTYEEFTPGTMQVKVGDTVKGGQKLAIMGVSGNSTGEHLHLGINDKGLAPLNPAYWNNPGDFIGLPNKVGTFTRPANIQKPG